MRDSEPSNGEKMLYEGCHLFRAYVVLPWSTVCAIGVWQGSAGNVARHCANDAYERRVQSVTGQLQCTIFLDTNQRQGHQALNARYARHKDMDVFIHEANQKLPCAESKPSRFLIASVTPIFSEHTSFPEADVARYLISSRPGEA